MGEGETGREMKNILLRITSGTGLGDLMGFTIVLRHLAKYRPQWTLFVQSPKHGIFDGLCERHIGEHVRRPFGFDLGIDETIDIGLRESVHNWDDRPNTKAVACLHDVFGLPYDPELGRYVITRSQTKLPMPDCVTVHYKGHSYPENKNLTDEQYADINQFVRTFLNAGFWCCLLGDNSKNQSFHVEDTKGLASHIADSRAFVGIDSGPGKVASATDTPTLICWTGHHPLWCHDPSPNTEHLVPEWKSFGMTNRQEAYFAKTYRSRTYSPGGLVEGVKQWLRETLT